MTFTITNPGTAPLNLSPAPTIIGTAEFSISTPPAATVAAGGSTSLIVTCTPTSRGAKNATLRIASNVAGTKNPYDIALTAKGTAPVIVVEQPTGANIPDGGAKYLGDVYQGSPESFIFTIRNIGDATLTGLAVTLDGADAADFKVLSQPSSLPAGEDTTFIIQVTPSVLGSRAAAIHITNNDPDIVLGNPKNPFDISLTANGVVIPVSSDAFGYKLNPATPASNLNLTTADPEVRTTNLTGDDQAENIDIGFSFLFYDNAYTSCFASTNGLIQFGGSSTSYVPNPIPSVSTPNNIIAAFWTDLRSGTGRILYTTKGTAPNRYFVIQYKDVELYQNSAKKVSFQVLLYEGSNTIEIQYQRIDAFDANSRNIGIGIENPTGAVGIQHVYGPQGQDNLFERPAPFGITFTRPVIAQVESKYVRPDGTTIVDIGSLAIGLNPEIGTIHEPIGTVRRFEAPEFIYLNRNFQQLAAVGEMTDPVDDVAWYRLVNDGYAIDGDIVQGTHTFFTTTLTHDVTVIWRWKLECAVVIDSATGQGGFGNPTPEVGRQWYRLGDQFTAAIDSAVEDPGSGFRFRTIGYSIDDKNGALLSPGILFPNDLASRRATPPRTITEPLRMMWNFTGQVRYRFDASAADKPGTSLDGQSFVRVYQADRVTVDTTVYGTGLNTDVWIDSGIASGRKVEIGAFYRSNDQLLTLGSLAGPPGGDLAALQSVDALNDDTTIPDQQGLPRVSRTYTVRNAYAPTEIHWVFPPTIFRAEIPLGMSFDGLNRSNQLVPALPAGLMLRVSDTGPGVPITTKIFPPDGSFMVGDPLRWDSLGKGLFPTRPGCYEVSWPDANDFAEKYKVEILTGYPGDAVTRASTGEAADGSRLREGVVMLTGCATTDASTTATCASTASLANGMSLRGPNMATGTMIASLTGPTTFVLSAPATGTGTGLTLSAWKNYQDTVTLPEIDPNAGFPAQAEDAHYHHLFDPVPGRQAPTKLDLSDTDEWKFQDLTFADAATGATVSKATSGVPFTALDAGRSVLLFSYRPNSDEIADGNLTKESLAVRVVRSSAVNVLSRNDPKLVLGHHALKLGSGPQATGGGHGIIRNGGAPPTSAVVPGDRFVVDFWLNAKGLQPPAAVTLSNCTTLSGATSVACSSTAGVVPGMSLSGTTLPPAPRSQRSPTGQPSCSAARPTPTAAACQ